MSTRLTIIVDHQPLTFIFPQVTFHCSTPEIRGMDAAVVLAKLRQETNVLDNEMGDRIGLLLRQIRDESPGDDDESFSKHINHCLVLTGE